MNRKKIPILPCLLAAFFVVHVSTAQQIYSIRGKVVDEKGAPLVGAEVRADPLAGGPRSDIVRSVETDRDGRFSIVDLEPITYKIFAMKEAAGYPNTAFSFYSGNIFPTVKLTNSDPAAEVVLSIGPPAGAVIGTVRDAVSGNAITATFLLRRLSDTENWLSMSQPSGFRVLVPVEVDVSLEVSAAGYKTWYYGGASDQLNRPPIRLDSGKEMRLDIQLEPEEKVEKPPE